MIIHNYVKLIIILYNIFNKFIYLSKTIII